jgi:hypothetical protein
VKHVLVDAFTFEVARALHGHLSEWADEDVSAKIEQQRLMAMILALKDLGLLYYDDLGRTASICFGPEAIPLGNENVPDERLQELAAHKIRFKMKKSEMLRSVELSTRYRSDLDAEVVKRSWRGVGALIDLILEGSLRLVGPASKGGLIVEHLTRSAPEEKCYVWFSLSNKTHKEPIMVDLAEPVLFEGRHRFPLKADGQLFITLGPGV